MAESAPMAQYRGVTRKRNYRREYDSYHGKPAQILRRAQRNAARAAAVKRGTVKKGDSKEVDHVNAPRTGSLAGTRTRVVSRAVNRRIQPKRKKTIAHG